MREDCQGRHVRSDQLSLCALSCCYLLTSFRGLQVLGFLSQLHFIFSIFWYNKSLAGSLIKQQSVGELSLIQQLFLQEKMICRNHVTRLEDYCYYGFKEHCGSESEGWGTGHEGGHGPVCKVDFTLPRWYVDWGQEERGGKGGGTLFNSSLNLSLCLTQGREKEGKIEDNTFRTSIV